MKPLSYELNKYIASLNGDLKKYFVAAQNNAAYVEAVCLVWSNDAARLILDHTNAFYIRRDETPKKGPNKDKPYYICEICADDSLVRSELKTHIEILSAVLKSNGMRFEEIKIIPAKFGMKDRHPFLEKGPNAHQRSVWD